MKDRGNTAARLSDVNESSVNCNRKIEHFPSGGALEDLGISISVKVQEPNSKSSSFKVGQHLIHR